MNTSLSPHQQRTVHIIASDGRTRHSLTGFIIAPGLVLTCAHDIVDAVDLTVRTGNNRQQPLPAHLSWTPAESDELDVAVLEVPDLEEPVQTHLAWGSIQGFTTELNATGFGYPTTNRDPDDLTATGFHLTHLNGTILPGEGVERNRLVFRFAPGQVDDDRTWRGVSGMSLFNDNGRLLGLVSQKRSGWRNRWDLVSASSISAALQNDSTISPQVLQAIPTRAVEPPDQLIEPAYITQWGRMNDIRRLKARFGQVDFVGEAHHSHLERLLEWCRSDEDQCSVTVITGHAGSGKTRLAAELCSTLLQDTGTPWQAGFARTAPNLPWNNFLPDRPTLLVFDYSERHIVRDYISHWITHLDQEGNACPKIRIVLINRNTGPWLTRIDDQTDGLLSELKRSGLKLDLHIHIDDSNFGPIQRSRHAETAYLSFRNEPYANSDDLELLLEFVSKADIDSPLMIHIAALLVASGEPLPGHPENNNPQGDSPVQNQLLEHLLNRERRLRWNEYAALSLTDQPPAESDDTLHAICIANFTTPTCQELEDLLTASPLWSDDGTTAADRREAAKAIHDLYPGPDRIDDDGQSVPTIAALEPDLISEYLVTKIGKSDLDEISTRLHDHNLLAQHHDRMLHLTALISDHYPDTSKALDNVVERFLLQPTEDDESLDASAPQILATQLEKLVHIAVSRATHSEDRATSNLIALSLRRYDNVPEVLDAAARLDADIWPSHSPNRQVTELSVLIQTLKLRRRTPLGFTPRTVGQIREAAPPLHRMKRSEMAKTLMECTNAFFTWTSETALTYHNLGIGLSELRRYSDALIYFEYALVIIERLTESSSVDHHPNLAAILGSIGSSLHDLERDDEALEYLLQAVKMSRNLDMSSSDVLITLAMNLRNLGLVLCYMKRSDEALPYLEESVQIREGLVYNIAPHYPDRDQHLDKLITSLSTLGTALSDLGRHGEALAHQQRALELSDWLERSSPTYSPERAHLLIDIGNTVYTMGRYEEALSYYRQAEQVSSNVAQNDFAFIPLQAKSLNNIAAALGELERGDEAINHLKRTLQLYKGVSKIIPFYQVETAKSLHNMGIEFKMQDDRRKAVPYLKRAVKIREKLAQSNPIYLRELSYSLYLLSDVLTELRKPIQAWRYQKRLHEICVRIVRHDSDR
ncbi:tetratricopeptide repeat protein [Haloglycomyces albus]|uniref:tetratricopeptide repeat protein n=1 Tax=Haloglycomyces albus TaxID=526067 RepID=UPI00046CD485|nr:tetratricopeptide repeat protein [Haloglycomyces albus]